MYSDFNALFLEVIRSLEVNWQSFKHVRVYCPTVPYIKYAFLYFVYTNVFTDSYTLVTISGSNVGNDRVLMRLTGVHKAVFGSFKSLVQRSKTKLLTKYSNTLPLSKAKDLSEGVVHCKIAIRHVR